MKVLGSILLAMVLLTACSSGKPLTNEFISQYGTRTFTAPYEKVWKAAEGVLSMEGYEVAYADMEKGVLNTKQKLLGATGQANPYSYQVTSAGIYRQYLIKITRNGDQCTVVLTPKVFQGNADISDKPVWMLEGEQGEKTLFEKFFREMEELL